MSSNESLCPNCQCSFTIHPLELDFYARFPAPAGAVLVSPKLCPDCRLQRRLCFRHETKLYKRNCDLSARPIISAYSTDKPYKVYSADVYWSDAWDPLQYGADYNRAHSFFEQFKRLQLNVPRINLLTDPRNENSSYVNQANRVRNCYLVWGSVTAEDCYYSYRIFNSRDSMDCAFVENCELCYECFDCADCYASTHLIKSTVCRNSAFLFDCHSCSNCLFSSNLKNKQYHIFNQAYSKEQYESFWKELSLNSAQGIEEAVKQFERFKSNIIYCENYNLNCENARGDDLTNCKNSSGCFNCRELEDCRYCMLVAEAKNCQDLCYSWENNEACFECCTIGEGSYGALACVDSWNIQHCAYCDTCINCKNCFGCIGLMNKEYCILNRQYSAAQYKKLLEELVAKMVQDGEFGEFFPAQDSSLAYNETPAQIYFPLNKEQVLARKLVWKEPDPVVNVKDRLRVPDSIFGLLDDVLNKTFSCKDCQRAYKLIKPELELHRRLEIALPQLCVACRLEKRLKNRTVRKLSKSSCSLCHAEIESTYAGLNINKLYCDSCYFKQIHD